MKDRVNFTISKVFNPGATNEYIACTKFNHAYINVPVFYLTKLMLIRAEAAILKSNPQLNIAIGDVNKIRERAYGNTSKDLSPSSESDAVLVAVRKERRLELMAEGNRLHDLNRIGSEGESGIYIRGVSWDYVGLVIQFGASEVNELFVANPEPN